MSERDNFINHQIWQVVMLIPPGRVATYGDVAGQAGIPRGARRVGYALHQLPPDTRVPWHRVINAQGRISRPASSGGQHNQRARLEAEGVTFQGDRISLRSYRWSP